MMSPLPATINPGHCVSTRSETYLVHAIINIYTKCLHHCNTVQLQVQGYERTRTAFATHLQRAFAMHLLVSCEGVWSGHETMHLQKSLCNAPPLPESSCSRSSYQRFLVSELKYTFPNTFRTARARVSRNLNVYYPHITS